MSQFEIRPITPTIGAEIVGLDLAEPLDDETFAGVERAFLDRQVLVFRNQDIPVDRVLEFARRFGPVSLPPIAPMHPDHPEVMVFELTEPRGAGADTWHVDAIYTKEPPKATILQAVTLPETGGDTYFGNMVAAYDALSKPLRELLSDLRAVHDISAPMRRAVDKGIRKPEEFEATCEKYPPVDHPLVRTHPETGHRSLFLAANSTTEILGLRERESELILPFLLQHVTSGEFHCRVRWEPHTIAFWDQRCTLHYAVPDYCERRVMYRYSIEGEVPR
ncbi:MAG: taurine dioxygenase [bacterium]|nr:taurine dioxygenase [bacterium]